MTVHVLIDRFSYDVLITRVLITRVDCTKKFPALMTFVRPVSLSLAYSKLDFANTFTLCLLPPGGVLALHLFPLSFSNLFICLHVVLITS